MTTLYPPANFTGVWELQVEKSTLRGPAPKAVLVKIEHREPTIVQEIQTTRGEGAELSQLFKFEVGVESMNSENGIEAHTHARWEGKELVIETWMKTPAREFHFKDHWSLAEDGQRLTMAHRDDDLAGQVSVLEKAAPNRADKFDKK